MACKKDLAAKGGAVPRSCAECQHGPCKYYGDGFRFPLAKPASGLNLADAVALRSVLARLEPQNMIAQVAFGKGDEIFTDGLEFEYNAQGRYIKADDVRVFLRDLLEVAPRLGLEHWQAIGSAVDRVLL
jgi:hypothetical protein